MTGPQEQFDVDGITYVHKDDHRNRSPGKSQWVISKEDERRVFAIAIESNWKDGDSTAWGIHRGGVAIEQIGLSAQRLRALYFAKFIGASQPIMWHGYPADHQANNADIPGGAILKSWLNRNVLPKSAIAKITKGKPWNP